MQQPLPTVAGGKAEVKSAFKAPQKVQQSLPTAATWRAEVRRGAVIVLLYPQAIKQWLLQQAGTMNHHLG